MSCELVKLILRDIRLRQMFMYAKLIITHFKQTTVLRSIDNYPCTLHYAFNYIVWSLIIYSKHIYSPNNPIPIQYTDNKSYFKKYPFALFINNPTLIIHNNYPLYTLYTKYSK